jgi:hypothetical protein
LSAKRGTEQLHYPILRISVYIRNVEFFDELAPNLTKSANFEKQRSSD